jgi:putative ABC transport system permease protein
MNINDLISMASQNLWRTKLRTTLTLIGVIIGIGALISMVSFGIGLEKNITEQLKSNDLFTSLTISTKAVNFRGPHGNRPKEKGDLTQVPLNDSLVKDLQGRPEVALAYPRINLPLKIVWNKDTQNTNSGSLPMEMGKVAPYNELYAGSYFSNDSAKEALVSLSFLRKLGLEVRTQEHLKNLGKLDSGMQLALADTIIGKQVALLSQTLKTNSAFALIGGIENVIEEQATTFTIVGILKEEQFAGPTLREEIILPLTTAKKMPSIGFDRISDLMENKMRGNQYASIAVKAKNMEGLATLKTYLKEREINYFALDDGLAEMKKAFVILDSVLGIVGLISLMVAGFGIVNTMLMSIMERKREIGIMKAVGGKNKDIRMIFFFEAGFIGFVGAIGGILLGYGLTRLANIVVNSQYVKNASEPIDLFAFPTWLLGGAIAFSILLSLGAGLYPAIRASRINPIDALRQEG